MYVGAHISAVHKRIILYCIAIHNELHVLSYDISYLAIRQSGIFYGWSGFPTLRFFMGARPVDEVVYMRTKSNMRSNILMGTLLIIIIDVIGRIRVLRSNRFHCTILCKQLTWAEFLMISERFLLSQARNLHDLISVNISYHNNGKLMYYHIHTL